MVPSTDEIFFFTSVHGAVVGEGGMEVMSNKIAPAI